MGIKINKQDLEIIIEVSQLFINYKAKTLKLRSWRTFEEQWIPKLVDQIDRNDFTWNDPSSNTAAWLIDQIQHSRLLVCGCEPEQGPELATTKIGSQALEILKAMQQGQLSYDSLRRSRQFEKLFT